MSDVTRIIQAIQQGDRDATDRLLPLVYEELRRLAAEKLSHERPGQTLQATALVHEAYLRLIASDDQNWSNRYHFFTAAAEAMRRILIESARRKMYLRHGGNSQRIPFDEAMLSLEQDGGSLDELIALDEALGRLAQKDRQKAELVKLRYFAGLTSDQAAEILGISSTTADRYWAYARCWLRSEIRRAD